MKELHCEQCSSVFLSPKSKRFCCESCMMGAWRTRRRPHGPWLDPMHFVLNNRAKVVPWDGNYIVTDDGRIFSCTKTSNRKTVTWIQLKPAMTGSRRQYETVCVSGKRWDIHRLVARIFHGPCPEGQEVRHLDGNSTNNKAENLAYGTRRQNMDDARRHGKTAKGTRNPRVILNEDMVREIRLRLKSGEKQCSIAVDIGVSGECISQISTGKRWGWLD